MRVNTAVLLLLCWLPNTVLANTMEKFPEPPRTQSWWVSKGNVHNGQVVYIKRFKSSLNADAVADFYRHEWRTDSDVPGYMQNEQEGWLFISHLKPVYQWVVQIKPSSTGSGSEGMLSAMKLKSGGSNKHLRRKKFTESLRGGDLLSSTESTEPSPARTQMHLYPNRPNRVANQFKTHMVSTGWSLQDEYKHQGAFTQRFEKAKRQIDVALVAHEGNKTLVFFNEVLHREN